MSKKTPLISRLHIFLAALFILQPVMDVISYWLAEFSAPGAITLLMRMGILGITVLLGFLLSDRKWIYWVTAGICILFFAAHAWACSQVGYTDIVGDFTNYIRIIQMPVTVICLITFLRQGKEQAFTGMQIGLTGALLVILLVEILSVLTGTDPHTYSDGIGTIGWFNNTNSQSSNLSVLVPISLAWQLSWKRRRPVLFWLTAAGGLFALFFLCPRLAYLGIVATTVGLCISILLIQRKEWKIAVALGLVCLIFLAMIPISPMGEHIIVDSEHQSLRQSWVNTALGEELEEVKEKQKKVSELTEEEYRELVETLTPIYEHYIGDFVEIFGAEETMVMYNFTTDIHDFSALRPKKLMYAALLMDSSPLSARFFGLELSRFTMKGQIYDVENDFHGVYYLCGGVGLALYLAFIGYFIYLVVWALKKNFKRYFTYEAAGYGIAFLMCMAHVYNTAGVLRRPNASIFLSAILAAIYYLVRLRQYPEQKTQEQEKLPE